MFSLLLRVFCVIFPEVPNFFAEVVCFLQEVLVQSGFLVVLLRTLGGVGNGRGNNHPSAAVEERAFFSFPNYDV